MKHILASLCIVTFAITSGRGAVPSQIRNAASTQIAGALIQDHEQQSKFQAKFMNGRPGNWSDYPFTVLMSSEDTYLLAGGAIIHEQYVLTSRDIFFKSLHQKRIKVYDVTGETRNVVDALCDGAAIGYVALLKVDKKFDFSKPGGVRTIKLRNEPVSIGTNSTVVGVNDPKRGKFDVLNLPIAKMSECRRGYPTVAFQLGDAQLCGSYYEDEQYPLCEANVGDPLVCDGELCGVTSVVIFCGNDKKPGVYGNVPYHKKWIEEQINGSASADPPFSTCEAATTTTLTTTTSTTTTATTSSSSTTTTTTTEAAETSTNGTGATISTWHSVTVSIVLFISCYTFLI